MVAAPSFRHSPIPPNRVQTVVNTHAPELDLCNQSAVEVIFFASEKPAAFWFAAASRGNQPTPPIRLKFRITIKSARWR